jgi:hypothetical protein
MPKVTYNTEKGELGYAKPRQVIVKLSNNKKNYAQSNLQY